jgi:hypothetical protein
MKEKEKGVRLSDPWGRELYVAPGAVIAIEDVGESTITRNVFFRSVVTIAAGAGLQLRLKVRDSALEIAKAAGMV